MAFTEYYCNASTGSNVNAGSTEGAPVLSLTGGDWVSATGVFTKTGAITGVSVGMFAAVRVDGATVAALVGRVTAVDANTITISTTAKSGSLANQTATCSIEVGGVWKGPNGTEDFPFGFITNALTDASSNSPRVNFKSGTNYDITAAVAHANAGPITFQGYTTTAGDGGRATIDGGTSGASYVMLTISATAMIVLEDLIFQNNGATGSESGVVFSAASSQGVVRRCVFHDLRGIGLEFFHNQNVCIAYECEAYACNQNNSASKGGFVNNNVGNGEFINCISHDNTGSNNSGFWGGEMICLNCISESNGARGFEAVSGAGLKLQLINCDAYNNGSDGIRNSGSGIQITIINCNLVKNGGWGINSSGATTSAGFVQNCGFGSGTQANTSGTTTGLRAVKESGSVNYASDVTPYRNPADGDFTLTLAEAKASGRGDFTQTASSYSGTVSYPARGAAQPFPYSLITKKRRVM